MWFNAYISSNPDITFIGNWSIKGINQIKDIIDKNGIFNTHSQLIQKYDITTPFLQTLQLLASIPKSWKTILQNVTIIHKSIPSGNIINVNNKDLTIEKVKCKDFYWHFINIQTHMPNNIYKWCKIYPDFKTADSQTWPRIFKLPFNLLRN